MPELRVLHIEQSKGFCDIEASCRRIETNKHNLHTPLFREPLQRWGGGLIVN